MPGYPRYPSLLGAESEHTRSVLGSSAIGLTWPSRGASPLSVGADLVVLSDTPLEVSIGDLPDIDVLATIVGGQIAYCAPKFAGLCG